MAGGPAATGGGIGANAPKVCSLSLNRAHLSLTARTEQMGWYHHDRLCRLRWYPLRVSRSPESCYDVITNPPNSYDTGSIGGIKVMDNWLETFGHPLNDGTGKYGISTSTESLVVSILSAGTFFGALLAVSHQTPHPDLAIC